MGMEARDFSRVRLHYSEPVKVNKKSKNKAYFPQNKYNFEELEETLLGN